MCRADNDVWMRKGFNKAGEKVWEYVLIYSDDLLIVARNPGEVAAQVDQHFKLKEGSIKEPTSCLGADIGKFKLPDDSEAWFMGSENYVKEAIKNVESWMRKRAPKGSKWVGLKTKVSGCFPSNWAPETDTSPLLNDEDAHWFSSRLEFCAGCVNLDVLRFLQRCPCWQLSAVPRGKDIWMQFFTCLHG